MMNALHKLLLCHLLTCLGLNALGSEIANGKKVPKNLMLYMASVQHNKVHQCGGFLISEDWVVTAAHCDNPKLSVVLGTHDLKNIDEGTMRYNVTKCKHPSYNKVRNGNDIMLLKLSKKARLDNKVQPIQLPRTETKMKDRAKYRVAGWGFTSTSGKTVDVLQSAEVPIVNLETCKREWKHAKVNLPANVICTGGNKTKTGFCKGDSGGPLVNGPTAVGVMSFKFDNNCDYPSAPNVYTDISKYLKWIKDTRKKKTC